MKIIYFIVVSTICLGCTDSTVTLAQPFARPFTVADDIGLTLFGAPTGSQDEMHFSPDDKHFAVFAERGSLDLNRVEDSLRFYRSSDVEIFLEHSGGPQLPRPIWVVTRSYRDGRDGFGILKRWHWLADSSGVVFLETVAGGNQRLVLANLRTKTIEPLTSVAETVTAFDVHDRQHFVYSVADSAPHQKLQAELQSVSIVGTGHHIFDLLFPDNPKTIGLALSSRSHLWAVTGGARFEVKHDGAPILFSGDLSLSPDGGSLVTTMPIADVPVSWERLYPPSFVSSSPYRIRPGHYDVQSIGSPVHHFVLIHLQTGSIRSLSDAPISSDVISWAYAQESGPSWSSDGHGILLPGTFLEGYDNAPSRPCVAVIDLISNTRTCVESLKGSTEMGVEEGYHEISDVHFVGGDRQRVLVTFHNYGEYYSLGTTEYRRAGSRTWQVVEQSTGTPEIWHQSLTVKVKQGLNEPPKLVATNRQRSRVIWDPNPQLKNIELTQVSVYTWKDKVGRDWKGGLFKPGNYQPGRNYPLVIQTHGFMESRFIPSGLFPTAFAARELAAAGMFVLQVEEPCPSASPDEGPCAVSGYETAIAHLVSEGLVDPKEIGIIGFSRTCFYVMETLTTSSLHFKAASITSGILGGYVEYIDAVDYSGSGAAREFDSMIGASPFSKGLQQWLKRSPGFNLDKVDAPLLVVAEGPLILLSMWEPYAGLRYLNKPVDLVMLNTDEHVLTNPAGRLASQGGSVDWFRFWLKNEEDPDPAKTGEYLRWRKLRELQKDGENRTTSCQDATN
jgi:dipeptidyl aminopeptidase/acylaminoacyl peptidase